jgi:pimeloyl-ACP methyl ester carboxylesterase
MPAPPDAVTAANARGGCALWLGLLLAPLSGLLLLGWLGSSLSLWTAALGIGTACLTLGCWARVAQSANASRLLGAGAALVLGSWLLRAVWVSGSESARLTVLPDDSGPRLLSKLYPEPDGTVLAARLVTMAGRLHDVEAGRFPDILREAFARTEPAAGTVPTPAIATYLGLQSPEHFDTLVVAPPKTRVAADAAVVFLHGYAGNFYVYCWELAQAAAAANLVTLCPSVDGSGAWWTPVGEQTLRATLEYAHRAGMNRIYLAGLSNGAAGASVLVLSHLKEISGLVLISGVRAAEPPPLPTLVVQGSSDQMMSAAGARAYAARGQRATYREIPGGHLIFFSDHERVRSIISSFLLGLEQQAPASPAFVSKPKK